MHSKGGRLGIRCDLLRRRAAVPVSVVPCIHRLRWPGRFKGLTGVLVLRVCRGLSLGLLAMPYPSTRTDISVQHLMVCPSRSGSPNIGKVRSQTSVSSLSKPRLPLRHTAPIQNLFLQLLMDVSFELNSETQSPPGVFALADLGPLLLPYRSCRRPGYASADGEKCARTLIIAAAYPEACAVGRPHFFG